MIIIMVKDCIYETLPSAMAHLSRDADCFKLSTSGEGSCHPTIKIREVASNLRNTSLWTAVPVSWVQMDPYISLKKNKRKKKRRSPDYVKSMAPFGFTT